MMTEDLEQRLLARASDLPQPPPLPDEALIALRQRTTASSGSSGHRHVSQSGWLSRRRLGGVLAFAAIATAGGIAIAGVGPFSLPSRAQEQLGIEHATVVGTVRDGTQEVVVAPGIGEQTGKICVSLANRQGPDAVSPVVCQPVDRVDDPGFGHAERPDRGDGWWLHVRLPDPDDPRSAIVSEAAIPEMGGNVTIDSGGRSITERFPDMSRFNAAGEQNLVEFQEEMRQLVLDGLREPRAQRLLPTLPAEQRKALLLRVVDRLTYAQISAQNGIDQAEVRSRISQAIRTLGIDTRGMLP